MMMPVESYHHFVSIKDNIEFNPELKGHLGLRYDWAKHEQKSLNGLACKIL